MFCHSGVCDDAVYFPFGGHDCVDCGLDAGFNGDVCLDVFEVGVSFLESEEVFAWFHQVERVDLLG